MSTPLVMPAISSFNSQLWLGGPTSPPSYILQARIGNIEFTGIAIDMVDVSNQTSNAHRMLGTLLKSGDFTFDLYMEPSSTQDTTLLELMLTAPPALQQWKVTLAESVDGASLLFNGYLSKFPIKADIGKALVTTATISIDGGITFVPGAGPE